MTSCAAAYEALLVPEGFRPWAELMVREAKVREGMQTLDVACGTGVVARWAARLCGASGGSTYCARAADTFRDCTLETHRLLGRECFAGPHAVGR